MKKIILATLWVVSLNANAKTDDQYDLVVKYSFSKCMSIYYGGYEGGNPAARDFSYEAWAYMDMSTLNFEWGQFSGEAAIFVKNHPRSVNDDDDEHNNIGTSWKCETFSKSKTVKNLYLTLPRR